jgi:hypothetical protein
MDRDTFYLELSCGACGWSETCDPSAVARWLDSADRLRRDQQPELEIMHEVLRGIAGELACPDCAATGLSARQISDADFDWPEVRQCESCGQLIATERLEALPDTKLCAACQQSDERGETTCSELEFCPRCGSIMELRLTRGAGIARYTMQCTGNPACRS